MIKIAFCSDCDGMPWKDYLFVHNLCEELSLPVGDSFWLFDPSGKSEMALFCNDVAHKAANHDNVLEHIKSGRLDVLHSIGDFRDVDVAAGYVYPPRQEVAKALSYLSAQGCSVRIHTSHGNTKNIHNMTDVQRTYQRGDLPFSRYYIYDLLRDFGIEYYWNLNLMGPQDMPSRLVSPWRTPSGDAAWAFQRYGKWRATAHTLPEQLSRVNLERALELQQNLIIFTHWGTKGSAPAQPHLPLWHRRNIAALVQLSELQKEGKVKVMRLGELLDEERQRPLAEEVDRVASALCRETYATINEYYSQMFTTVGAGVFARLAERIGLRGQNALDVGGGSGNLALHLAGRFERVLCTDTSEEALRLGQDVATRLHISNVDFVAVSVEKMRYQAETFDAIFCRGVLYLLEGKKFLHTAHRMLRPGGVLYITSNADGFYHWFFDNVEVKPAYLDLLWNTFFRRNGGIEGMARLWRVPGVAAAVAAQRTGTEVLDVLEASAALVMPHTISPQSVCVREHVEKALRAFLLSCVEAEKTGVELPASPPTESWICRAPEELEAELHEAGFSIVEWQSQSEMGQEHGLSYNPGDTYKGMLATGHFFAVK